MTATRAQGGAPHIVNASGLLLGALRLRPGGRSHEVGSQVEPEVRGNEKAERLALGPFELDEERPAVVEDPDRSQGSRSQHRTFRYPGHGLGRGNFDAMFLDGGRDGCPLAFRYHPQHRPGRLRLRLGHQVRVVRQAPGLVLPRVPGLRLTLPLAGSREEAEELTQADLGAMLLS